VSARVHPWVGRVCPLLHPWVGRVCPLLHPGVGGRGYTQGGGKEGYTQGGGRVYILVYMPGWYWWPYYSRHTGLYYAPWVHPRSSPSVRQSARHRPVRQRWWRISLGS